MMPEKIFGKTLTKTLGNPIAQTVKKTRIVKGFSVSRQINETQGLNTVVSFSMLARQKTITCTLLIHGLNVGPKIFRAKAVCQEGDVFSVEEGMNIALKKAQTKLKEHLNHQYDKMAKELNAVQEAVETMTDTRHAAMLRTNKYQLRP